MKKKKLLAILMIVVCMGTFGNFGIAFAEDDFAVQEIVNEDKNDIEEDDEYEDVEEAKTVEPMGEEEKKIPNVDNYIFNNDVQDIEEVISAEDYYDMKNINEDFDYDGLIAESGGYVPRKSLPSDARSSITYYSASQNPYPFNVGNCTWYAFGRAWELLGYYPSSLRMNRDAYAWFSVNKSNYDSGNGGFPYSTDPNAPALGAIACWSKDSNPGSGGHVAVVEEIYDNQNGSKTIYTSESGYGNYYFKYINRNTLTKGLGWPGYTFLGYIYILDSSFSDTEQPIISDVNIYDVYETGCTISCRVVDNVGVTKVLFPTWSVNTDSFGNAQDDLQSPWPEGERNGDIFTFHMKISDHNNEINTEYITDIYAYDEAGNYNTSRLNYDVFYDNEDPVIYDVYIDDFSETQFRVNFMVSDNIGISKIHASIWTPWNKDINGKETDERENIVLYEKKKNKSRGTKLINVSFYVDIKNHNNEKGTAYNVNIGASDAANNNIYSMQTVVFDTVSFFSESKHDIVNNDFNISTRISNCSGNNLSSIGFFLGTDKNKMKKYEIQKEKVGDQFQLDCQVSNYVGALKPETVYYWQFYAIDQKGNEYKGVLGSLLTLQDQNPSSNIESPIFSITDLEVMVGNTVTVPVKIHNNPGIAGFTYDINYDKKILTLKSVNAEALISGNGTFSVNDNVVSWYASDNIKGDGNIINCIFEVSPNAAAGSYPVSISLHDGKNNLVDENGKFINASYSAGHITVTKGMLGDLNGDNDITIADIVLLNRHVLGKTILSSEKLSLADVNKDGDITIGDVVLLNRHLLGKVNIFKA